MVGTCKPSIGTCGLGLWPRVGGQGLVAKGWWPRACDGRNTYWDIGGIGWLPIGKGTGGSKNPTAINCDIIVIICVIVPCSCWFLSASHSSLLSSFAMCSCSSSFLLLLVLTCASFNSLMMLPETFSAFCLFITLFFGTLTFTRARGSRVAHGWPRAFFRVYWSRWGKSCGMAESGTGIVGWLTVGAEVLWRLAVGARVMGGAGSGGWGCCRGRNICQLFSLLSFIAGTFNQSWAAPCQGIQDVDWSYGCSASHRCIQLWKTENQVARHPLCWTLLSRSLISLYFFFNTIIFVHHWGTVLMNQHFANSMTNFQ